MMVLASPTWRYVILKTHCCQIILALNNALFVLIIVVFAIEPICDDYNGSCFSHVAVRQCSLNRSVEKVFDLKIQKNVRSIKLSVHNPSLRTTATQSQGGVQGAVTLSMEDSGWATRKYYHPLKALIIIHSFSRAGVRVLSYSNWLIIFLPTNEKPSSFSLSTNDKPPYIQ